MIDIFEKCSKRAIQDDLRDQGIYPYFHYLETRQAPEVIMEGKRRIMLGSNNYLGLTTNPEVMDAAIKAAIVMEPSFFRFWFLMLLSSLC